jgi:hypothetical protein
MSVRAVVVDNVICRQAGQVAVHVAPPEGVDLQFIYRAALSIYWNPAEALLEDRSDVVESAETSAARIAQALREEYGMALQPSGNMRWTGFIDEEQDQVASALFGYAR